MLYIVTVPVECFDVEANMAAVRDAIRPGGRLRRRVLEEPPVPFAWLDDYKADRVSGQFDNPRRRPRRKALGPASDRVDRKVALREAKRAIRDLVELDGLGQSFVAGNVWHRPVAADLGAEGCVLFGRAFRALVESAPDEAGVRELERFLRRERARWAGEHGVALVTFDGEDSAR